MVSTMTAVSYDGALPLGLVIVGALVLIGAWVIVAGSRFIQGGVVERPERVPQLYGYTVCLVVLFWGITSLLSLVKNVQSLSAPELRQSSMSFGFEPSVSSFEAFRATYDQARRFGPREPGEKLDSIPEAELRQRYEGLRADRIRRGRIDAQQDLVRDVVSLLIAAFLFVWHWRWLRRRVAVVESPAVPLER